MLGAIKLLFMQVSVVILFCLLVCLTKWNDIAEFEEMHFKYKA